MLLNFEHLGLDKQCKPRSDWRSSLIRVFPVCYSDKHFMNSSPDNQNFIWEKKEKSIQNFLTLTVTSIYSHATEYTYTT